MNQPERKIFTLAQLSHSLENFFMKNFGNSAYWVTAEITKISLKGGHRYLELVDAENDSLLAQFQANLWFTNHKKAIEDHGEQVNEILQSGNRVLFYLRIEYHKIFGLKLNILSIDPSYSYGEMERQKQLTIEKLKSEDLYFQQKQLNLPIVLRKIGLISSPETSGYRDFISELQTNTIYNNFNIKIFPSSVQGQEAKIELIRQIKEAQKYNIDVLVLIRGGGSKTDLNVFNDYELCKEICLSRVPVITGIGHETDDVVAAHVSRMDCITPTAAAKYIYIQIGTFLSELRSAFDYVVQQALVLIQAHQLEFQDAKNRLNFLSREHLYNHKLNLEDKARLFHRLVHFNLVNHYQDLDLLLVQIASNSQHQIATERNNQMPRLLERITQFGFYKIDNEKQAIVQLNELLDVVNPLKLLDKGYTISSVNNIDINALTAVNSGDQLMTLTKNSTIYSTIEKIKHHE